MEEWVGKTWHRWISRAADQRHADARVTLAEMKAAIRMLHRAGGGLPATRIAEAQARAHGGPRGWLQRLAGSGERSALARLEPEVLALPAEIAVFPQRELNRDLYLWLAALSACYAPEDGWLADNLRASRAALRLFPGLAARQSRLLQAQLALRPPLRVGAEAGHAGDAAEAAVQQALRGELPEREVQPQEVAPVWIWLLPGEAQAAATARARREEEAGSRVASGRSQDRQRRHARRSDDEGSRHGLLMFFRTESLLSWSEFVKVDRATDDEDDGNARAAADDMQTLSVAEGGQTLASRVRFDLDLPSASADDQPLGPGERLPEWDYRRGLLEPGRCALQGYVNAGAPAFRPEPGLRRAARRMRQRLELLRAAPQWQRGMEQGEEIDLDAWVRHRADAIGRPASSAPRVYARQARGERSLATVLLADLSLSTDAHVSNDARVIDVVRDALYVFGEALDGVGDAFEMLGFSSVRRQHVRIQHLKGFDEAWGEPARARVGAIKPGYYTRMGAAIRHASARLAERPERQRLLLLLTDGKPNDLDHYEGRFGLEDTRHAVQEARAAGLLPFCVTIDEQAQDYLPHLFGSQGYALVRRPQDLVLSLPRLYASLAR